VFDGCSRVSVSQNPNAFDQFDLVDRWFTERVRLVSMDGHD